MSSNIPLKRPFNLPAELSSFVGREREITEIKRLLTTSRLVTLTGAGGCGKTRLALRIATDLTSAFDDGICLVELAALSDAELIPHAILTALNLREQPESSLTQTLTDYLQPKHLLLVLDKCEHLIEAGARLTEQLLRACPHLRILAASREALKVPGEVAWLVSPLSLPYAPALPPADRLLDYEAMRLFVDRAGVVLTAFALSEDNASTVVQVCRRLDGIPLAIELAAARMKVLSVEQIAARLDHSFELLTDGARTALPRHRTLHAALDWSYDLLSEPERALLRRLSVFAGSFSLEAAKAIANFRFQISDFRFKVECA